NWLVERPPLSAVAGDKFDTNVREDRYAMVLFGTILVVLVGLLGRRVGRSVPGLNADTGGLVAAGAVAVSPNVWVNDGLGMSETLTGPDACIDCPAPPGGQPHVARVYRKRAFTYLRQPLRRLPLVVAARIGRTWSLYRRLDMVNFNKGEGRESWVTRLGLLVYYPTLILAVAGAIAMWRRPARRALWVLLV